ncbi:MAG: porin family protein [Cyclobacteriaceae bacterium]
MRFLSITIVLLFISHFSIIAQVGYIATDTSRSQGYIVDQGIFKNNREVKYSLSKDKSTPTETYLPQDLKEFQISDDDIYVTKTIQDNDTTTNTYFLLRLTGGEHNLYMLKNKGEKRFFGETNEELQELPKNSYKEAITTMMDHTDWRRVLPLVRHNRKSLRRFYYLQNNSYSGVIPSFRKGLIYGKSNSSIRIKDLEKKAISIKNKQSTFFGAFIDFPMGLIPNWSINIQAYYHENNFNLYYIQPAEELDFVINTTSITVPLLVKYRTTARTLRGFVGAGASLSYYLERENQLLTTTKTGTYLEISKMPLNSINKYKFGALLGAGVECSIFPKYLLGLELRYNTGIGVWRTHAESHSLSELQFITSIWF